jgi:GT2 family glycosyltransferase
VTDVSIIVVAADVREEVLECLAAIDRHAGSVAVETILVDNGSRDGTADAVRARYPGTRLVRLRRNRGVAARNEGLRAATGRFRMFLDSDARLTDGALSELVAFMEAHPDVGLIGPRLVYPDGTLQLSARRFPPWSLPLRRRPPLERLLGDSPAVRRHLMADDRHDLPREVEYVLGACQLFSAAAQRAAGEFGRLMFYGPDDAEWCFRVRTAGFRVMYCPDAVVVHDYRRSTRSRLVSKAALSQVVTFYQFQWKWRRARSRLVREGRAMDARAAARADGSADPAAEAARGSRTTPVEPG